MRLTCLLLFSCIITSLFAQEINIIPKPAMITTSPGYFTIKQPVGFIYNEGVINDGGVSFFKEYVQKYYNIKEFKYGDTHSYGLPTEIFIDYDNEIKGEKYELTVDKKGIKIYGNEKGLFYAFQTLIQLLPQPGTGELKIPYCHIVDSPRFEYRGMHLDVARHFFPVSFIKKYIDYLALHKFNTFHWHLTDDQGWRIEIKKYPRLTSTGGYRNGTITGHFPGNGNDGIRYGGYYTQAEIKEVVKYAAERFITVIPEIEMPGHASAAIAAYPELSCFPDENTKHPHKTPWHGDTTGKQVQQTWGVFEDVFCAGKDNTFQFLQNVLDEVVNLFPGKYIHVGGDECPKENWKRCPECQKRIKDNNLKDEHELQSYLIQQMEKYLNSKGKTLIGWDEILEGGLAPNAVVMSWRGEKGGIEAAKQKHHVIMSPGNPVYFDYSQSENEDSLTIGGYNPIEKVYAYDPVPKELSTVESKYILGAQANVWTEYMTNSSKVEYMVFPRMAALSEVLWSTKEKRNWNDFEKRLTAQFKRYELWKANYSTAFYYLRTKILPSLNNNGVLLKLETNLRANNIKYEAVGRHYPLKYKSPILITDSRKIIAKSHIARNSVSSVEINFHLNKATGKKITLTNPASTKYPGDGPFTLVNGVQNEKGFARANEFLGFEGTNCEAIIDLGKKENISSVTIHSLEEINSWIWRPLTMEILISEDGINFTSIGLTDDFEKTTNGNGTMTESFNSINTRYLKIKVENRGTIPTGNPGAGNKAWLFVDEIEVN